MQKICSHRYVVSFQVFITVSLEDMVLDSAKSSSFILSPSTLSRFDVFLWTSKIVKSRASACVLAVTATTLAALGSVLGCSVDKRVETCCSVDSIVWRFLSWGNYGVLIPARKLASALVRRQMSATILVVVSAMEQTSRKKSYVRDLQMPRVLSMYDIDHNDPFATIHHEIRCHRSALHIIR